MKGVSLITLAFLVLAIALGAFIFYQTNILGGKAISRETIEAYKLDRVDLELQNMILYLEDTLIDSVQNASQSTAYSAGRNATIVNKTNGNITVGINETYLYWRCDLNEVWNSEREVYYQIPSVDRVRLSLQNFTMTYMENRLNELHGIRDGVVYQVGKNICSEVGYDEPMNTPVNDDFMSGSLIDKLATTLDNYKREEKNVSLAQEIKYNRFWYIYDGLKRWTKEQDMEGNIYKEVAKVPDYVDDTFCAPDCPCPYQRGCTRIPSEWATLVRRATEKGIMETVGKLYDDRYFDRNNVACGYTIANMWVENRPILIKARGPPCPFGWIWYCRLNYWYYVEVDTDVFCTDEKFRSIPRKDLENLNWRIRLNVEVKDKDIHKEFDPPCNSLVNPLCETTQSPDGLGTKYFPQCKIPDSDNNFKLCKSGVDVIGKISDEELKKNR